MTSAADEFDAGAAPAPEPATRPRRPRTVLKVAVAVGALVAALAGLLATRIGHNPDYSNTARLGKPVPRITLPLLDGKGDVSLGDQGGKVVLVNFFNSWCVPCNEERPSLQAWWAQHGSDPSVRLVGIVRDDTDRAVRSWIRQYGVSWTVVTDPASQAALDFGTTGQPETYAINADGIIVAQHFGASTQRDLDDMLAIARGQQKQ